MTELEKLQKANIYLEKLANGINPINDLPVADIDVVNNVQIARCFFYMSDILQELIKKEEKNERKKETKRPFVISDGQLQKYSPSTTPITITKVTKRINRLINEEESGKLNYNVILKWLVTIGAMAVEAFPDGSTRRYPTDNGKKLGIVTEEKIGPDGPYIAVLYDKNAQQFIVDNMRSILGHDI